MPRRKPRSLRYQLILLAALGLVPLALLGAWGIWTALDQQRRELERSTLDLSRALSTAVDSELDATIQSLAALSASQQLLGGDLRGFYETVRGEAVARPHWSSVILTDGAGRLVFKSLMPFGAEDDRVIDPASLHDAIRSGEPVVGRVAHGQLEQAAFPVRWPIVVDGRVAYVLTAAVRPDRIRGILARQHVPPSWVIAVHDSTGGRVARSKEYPGGLPGRPPPSLAALIASPADEGTGVTRTLEQDEVFTGYTRLNPYRWTISVSAPTAEFRAALTRSLAWYLAGMLASIVMCAVLALRVARRVTDAIGLVRDKAVRLGQGEAIALRHSRIAEVDEMAAALHTASGRLARSVRTMQQALVQAAEAARAKDQFLAMLGHELRNPLSPIVNALRVVERTQGLDARGEALIAMAVRQSGHLKRLVDDLIDVTRISQGKISLQRETVDVARAVAEAAESISATVAERRLDLRVSVAPSAGGIEADPTRLAQVLVNLLGNAAKFTPVGGRIDIRAEGDDADVRIEVEDSGLGIAPEHLEAIFELFTQVDATIDRQQGGLGIGLAWVRAIVEMHGGSVHASSPGKGKGARFSIRLPRRASVGSTPEAVPVARAETAEP